jgi:hypothetical protein
MRKMFMFQQMGGRVSWLPLLDLREVSFTMESVDMRKLLLTIAIVSSIALLPGVSSSKGCLKGAAVGGVVGHVAGHHAVAGAVAGCVIGHHQAKVKESEAAAANPQSDAARPAGTTPAR